MSNNRPFPKEKITSTKEDINLILINYWENISALFPKITLSEFKNYLNEDDQPGAEETHQNALGRREGKILYSLIRILKPKNILEIGTYDGVSTNHILKAAYNNRKFDGVESNVTTLDINDYTKNTIFVNYPLNKKIESSLSHLTHTNNYDFIFQDGDHTQPAVTQEIKLFSNMKNLKCVMAHDYFLPGRGIKPAYENMSKDIFLTQKTFKEPLYNSGFIISLK